MELLDHDFTKKSKYHVTEEKGFGLAGEFLSHLHKLRGNFQILDIMVQKSKAKKEMQRT